jgi:hypothetical protein
MRPVLGDAGGGREIWSGLFNASSIWQFFWSQTDSNQSIGCGYFFQKPEARVKCLFSHPIVFIINPLSYIALYFVILVCLTQTILLIKGRALALSGLIIEWQHSPPPPP